MKFNRANKYKAKRTSCGLHEHASKSEAIRCSELQALEKGKIIRDLEFQPRYHLDVRALDGSIVHVCDYVADWRYFRDGKRVVEDKKGMVLDLFKVKSRLMKAIYGIEVLQS